LRWSFIALVIVVVPAIALAKPKLAVAPLDGDKDGAFSAIVAEEASEHGKTTKPERVAKEIEKLEISSLSAKSVKKLRTKLDVDVVIHGRIEKDGGKKHLALVLTGPGKATLDVDFRTTKDLKKELASKLGAKIERAASASGSGEREEEEEEPEKKKKRAREEEEEREKREREEREEEAKKRKKKTFRGGGDDDDDDDKRKRTSSRDDDDDSSVRRGDDDDEDSGKRRKKKRKRGEDRERHALTQAAAWADAGVGFARRTLTYVGTGNMQPPPVGTAAPAGQIAAEVYPASFSTLKGPAAGIGIAGAFNREVGLGIAVPGTTVTTPITSGYYWIGARYRFSFGSSSIAVGASYWRRTYVADRSKLMMPEQLDMPDVDYTAIAPDLTGRFAASPKLGLFANVQLPLMLNSGPIQANTSYGPSTILAFNIRSGVQYAFGAHYALQVALGFDQIGFKFGAKQGTMAAAREVSAATDRSIGLAATFGIMY
jgi:hypothetical protein